MLLTLKSSGGFLKVLLHIQGYKAQSEMVLESLDKLIGACEGRKESMVVEGVHLSLNAVIRLMQKHPSIVPFLVHISNEAKHRERFAVRSIVVASSQKASAIIGVLPLQASSALVLLYFSNEVIALVSALQYTAILMHLSGTLSMKIAVS